MKAVQIDALSLTEVRDLLPGFDGLTPEKADAIALALGNGGRPMTNVQLRGLFKEIGVSNRYLDTLSQLLIVNEGQQLDLDLNEIAEVNDRVELLETFTSPITNGMNINLILENVQEAIQNLRVRFDQTWVNPEEIKFLEKPAINGDPKALDQLIFSKLPSADTFENNYVCITACVPDDVRDFADVSIELNDIEIDNSIELELAPSVRIVTEEDGTSSVQIFGSTLSQLVEITRTSDFFPDETVRMYSYYSCGKNVVPYAAYNVDPAQINYSFNILMADNPLLSSPSFNFMLLQETGGGAEKPVQIQLIGCKEMKDGKEVLNLYFVRNGKWFRILDPKQMSKLDPDGIDIDEDSNNFVPAAAEKSKSLNEMFFPDGWEKTWQAFDNPGLRQQLQILTVLSMKQLGLGDSEIMLINKIKRDLDSGKKPDDIFDKYQGEILGLLLGTAISIIGFKVLGKLFRLIFNRAVVQGITEVTKESGNKIILKLKDKVKKLLPKSAQDLGLVGELGMETIGGKRVKVLVGYSLDSNILKGAKKGDFGNRAAILEEWINTLRIQARKAGAKVIRVRQISSNKQQFEALQKLGFVPDPTFSIPNPNSKGIGRLVREVVISS